MTYPIGGAMSAMKGLEWTFDTAAKLYERMRPGYPDELYGMIKDYIPLDGSSSAVEVGIGGGQATEPILKTGCSVLAVEYGSGFTRLCREKFGRYEGFAVLNGRFEDTELTDNTYDLVYSASAFHWIPEEEGYRKVFSIFRKGGAFARFANHPGGDRGDPELWKDIQKAYDRYYYTYYNKKRAEQSEYSREQAAAQADIAAKYGFEDIRYALFDRTRTFTAAQYCMLLGTYSDHIAMEKSVRNEFFSDIEKAIDNHGGTVTIYDTIDLQLARKPV